VEETNQCSRQHQLSARFGFPSRGEGVQDVECWLGWGARIAAARLTPESECSSHDRLSTATGLAWGPHVALKPTRLSHLQRTETHQ
jgi:hypothetical protein